MQQKLITLIVFWQVLPGSCYKLKWTHAISSCFGTALYNRPFFKPKTSVSSSQLNDVVLYPNVTITELSVYNKKLKLQQTKDLGSIKPLVPSDNIMTLQPNLLSSD